MELRYSITDTVLTSIGDAIREKLDTTEQYKPSQMPEAIRSIKAGEDTPVIGGNTAFAAKDVFDFKSCIVSLEIPEGVVQLGNAALSACTELVEIKFPSTLTTLLGGAISNCTKLEVLEFPASLKTIGQSALNGCTNLKELHFKSLVPPTLTSSTSLGTLSGAKIYVPAAKVDTYKTATNWIQYASKIYAEE